MDPQNKTDVELEHFGAKQGGLSFLLVFLQTPIVVLSYNSKKQHSCFIERP